MAERLEHRAQLSGGAELVPDIVMGTALSVGGASASARLAHASDLSVIDGDFAVAFWFRPTAAPTGAWRSVLYKGDSGSERNFAIFLHPGNNRLHYRLSTSASPNDGGNSSAVLTGGEWHHLAYVRRGNRLSMYINGRLDSADTLGGEPVANTGVFHIGATPFFAAAEGDFADVSVYHRTVSQLEVRSLYKQRFPDANLEEQGVAFGSPRWHTEGGADGRVLTIDSAEDGVRLPNSIVTRPGTANWGMAFWVRLDEAPSGQWEAMIHKGTSAYDRNIALFREPVRNRLHIAVSLDTNANLSQSTLAELEVGVWNHVALTKDGGTLRVFINGAPDVSLPFNGGQPVYTDSPLYIGSSPWYAGARATYDDVTMFNYKLVQSDVERFMARDRDMAPAQGGRWSDILPWPQVPVSMANLPDGRILTWSGSERTTWPRDEQTFSSVWDHRTGQFDDLFQPGHNMFCAHLAMAEDGQVFVNGGRNQTNSPWTSLFDYRDNRWNQVENMATGGRWYPVTNALPNGEIMTSMGTATNFRNPEKWSASDGWQVLNGVDYAEMRQGFDGTTGGRRWWPILSVAPNGKLFHYWSEAENHFIDTSGVGAVVHANADVDVDQPTGVAIQYRAGRMIMSGRNQGARSGGSNRRAYTIDLNGSAPVVRQTQEMQAGRAFHNLVPLPNGEVIALGGATYSGAFNNLGAVYQAEIWNPQSGQWRLTARAAVPRNYHSTGALLADGRVLSAGGGYGSGNEWLDGASHQNAQVFSPPYLYNADGTPAQRPSIESAPGVVRAGQSFVVQTTADAVQFSMVRMGANTHAVNTDSRFLWLDAVANADGTTTLTPNANPNIVLPGYWMVFALNQRGVPSEAHIVRVARSTSVSTPGEIRYVKLIADSEVNGNSWTTVAELNVLDANGADIDRSRWQVSVDSAEPGWPAANAVDGNNNTFWHTVFSPPGQANDPNPPHELVVDLGGDYALTALRYLPRRNNANGRIADYRVQISADGVQWRTVASGRFENDNLEKTIPIGADPDTVMAASEGAGASGDSQTFQIEGDAGLEYRVSFGDGTQSAWSTATSVTHAFATPGRYVVVVTARDPVTGRETQTSFAHIVYDSTIDPGQPNRWLASTSVAFHPSLAQVWNVNPDNDSVTVIDAQSYARLAEIPVGNHPTTLAFDNAGQVWVVNRDSGSISLIDPVSRAVTGTVNLPNVRAQPFGILMPRDVTGGAAGSALVSLEGTDEIVQIDLASRTVVRTAQTVSHPRHLAQSPDASHVFVTSFITPPVPGEATSEPDVSSGTMALQVMRAENLVVRTTTALRHSDRPRSENSGPGLPNYIGPMAMHPAGHTAYAPSKQDNILGGGLRSNGVLTFDQAVRAISSRIRINGAQTIEQPLARIDHDNASVASAAVYGPYGIHLFTALEGNRQIAVSLPENNAEVVRFDVGFAPQGLALSPDGRTLAVHNFMGRSVHLVDIEPIVEFGALDTAVLAEVATVGNEALNAEVFYGKQLFYDARDDRLAALDYMSCASCHADGGDDGRVWDFTQFGEGVRNTITLRGRGGTAHGFVHWSANFDEIQDFEDQIRRFAGGAGLMDDQDFFAGTRSEPLGAPKTGLSGDLDALAAYTESLTRGEPSPYRPAAQALSAAGEQGRQVFRQRNCGVCHAAPRFTDSSVATLHDIGTITLASGARLGASLTGIDTPSLVSAWQTPPYLHDGSARTLGEAIAAHSGEAMTQGDLDALEAYLLELDEQTALIVDEPEAALYRAGIETVLQPDITTWFQVTFDVPFDEAPIVVMGPLSFNGGHPATLRVRNVTAEGFEFQVDEWDYLDGWHITETVSWLAVKPGRHVFGGLNVEAGSIVADGARRSFGFGADFGGTPVLFSQVVTANDAAAVTTRQANLTPNGFRLEVEEEENASGAHADETVHYLAFDLGAGTLLDGGRVLTGRTPNQVTDSWYNIDFGEAVDDAVFLSAMQTTDGGDTASVRFRSLQGSRVQVHVDEEQSRDTEVAHTTEVVGWLRISVPLSAGNNAVVATRKTATNARPR
ncbi:MAG: LamG-like jellyroll fold domain-containing protein [Pseudomonadota bacterium]